MKLFHMSIADLRIDLPEFQAKKGTTKSIKVKRFKYIM